MSDLPDWAFDEAREWLATQCDSKGVIPNAPSRTASLAALLLRVHLDALQPLRVEDLLAGQPRCACGVPGPEKESRGYWRQVRVVGKVRRRATVAYHIRATSSASASVKVQDLPLERFRRDRPIGHYGIVDAPAPERRA